MNWLHFVLSCILYSHFSPQQRHNYIDLLYILIVNKLGFPCLIIVCKNIRTPGFIFNKLFVHNTLFFLSFVSSLYFLQFYSSPQYNTIKINLHETGIDWSSSWYSPSQTVAFVWCYERYRLCFSYWLFLLVLTVSWALSARKQSVLSWCVKVSVSSTSHPGCLSSSPSPSAWPSSPSRCWSGCSSRTGTLSTHG